MSSFLDSIYSHELLDTKFINAIKKCSWINLYYGIVSDFIKNNNIKTVVEVGCGYGTHSFQILHDTNIDYLFMVDPYKPFNDIFSNDVQLLMGNFETLVQNIILLLQPFEHRYSLLRKPSTSVSTFEIPDNSIDLVFLDGDYSYNAVSNDLPFWFNKLKKGGYLLGDDYSIHPETTKAVDEFVQNNNLKLEFIYKHYKKNKKYAIYKIHKI